MDRAYRGIGYATAETIAQSVKMKQNVHSVILPISSKYNLFLDILFQTVVNHDLSRYHAS